jgi:outer membrane lipoprotein
MRNVTFHDVQLSEVSTNISAYKGQTLRWGGSIINVTNSKNKSQAQILFYPLNFYGKPQTGRESQGRFVINSTKFLDPAIYKEGNEITVTGILASKITQKIGEKNLTLPLLDIDHIHLWPKLQPIDDGYYRHYPYHFNDSFYYNSFYPYRYYRRGFYYNCL